MANKKPVAKKAAQVEEIVEEIRKRDVPALSFQEEDSFESYLNFYKELISEE